MSLTRKFKEWKNPPQLETKVDGFILSLTKHQSALMYDISDTGELTQTSEEGYYVVAMRRTGENPEYPGVENVKFHFAYAQKYSGMQDDFGIDWDVMCLKHDCRYTRFEIVEEVNPAGPRHHLDNVPEHHAVKLKVHYLDGKGQAKHAFREVEGWVRKSELEAPAWDGITGTTPDERRALWESRAADEIVLKGDMTVRKPLRLKRQS